MPSQDVDVEDLLRRAIAAYYRSDGSHAPAPDRDASEVAAVEGRGYVVLRNVNGVLKVYRVRPDGILKVLKNGPVALKERRPPNATGLQALLNVGFGFVSRATYDLPSN